MSRLIVILILVPFVSLAKSDNGILLEISAGIGSGWWVYNKGSLDGTRENHLGYDHTRTTGISSLGADLIYKKNGWKIGPGFEFSQLLENEMRETTHRISRPNEYEIAERSVKMYKFNVVLEYNLFEGRRYVLSPQLKLGSFIINTTHPNADNFGFRMHWSFGINNQIAFAKNASLLVRPFYSAMVIWPKEEINQGEKHNIYCFGLLLGLRFNLNNESEHEKK